ncbi:MAG: hypothetical protein KatS3mg068_2633 [Candidatus Sericytochromatia bacterium]|nr:MAG: hypothetical protein KatS3mg068_2633 [Candidatus Sericytochromatia bacterium]GIX41202.1 MAG: hypothetical protein KatS3mg129_0935 [Leptospiraceae bacterium]
MKTNRDKHYDKFINFYKNNKEFDVIIIGGGITGAGIALGCAMNHLNTLLIESNDFGYSSSGNSSKLVHGGLRYLQNGQFHITFQSVKEREKLLKELPKLIWPIYFILPYYNLKEKIMYKSGLILYDFFAGKQYHKNVKIEEILEWFPYIRRFKEKNNIKYKLKGGYLYQDAQTDDIRLLIRTLKEAENNGAIILNYFSAKDLLLEDNIVKGVIGYDLITQKEFNIKSKIVINATGFLADIFRTKLGLEKIMRPLRGSHIVIEYKKLPVKYALGFSHPEDKRNIFVLPWFGKTIVGTTDVDHQNQNNNPISISSITEQEIEYLLKGVNYQFPDAKISKKEIYSTWSGVRPVVSRDPNIPPSKESRDIFIEFYKNLLTVTGGKLTTFRLEAKKVLKILRNHFPIKKWYFTFKNLSLLELEQFFEKKEIDFIKNEIVDHERIINFYGKDSIEILKNIIKNPKIIANITFYKENNIIYEEELKYSIKNEWVLNWEDFYYRRFRFGIVQKEKEDLIKSLYKNTISK